MITFNLLDSSLRNWYPTTTYKVNDIVTHKDEIYESLVSDNLGNEPTPISTYWKVKDYTINYFPEQLRTEKVYDEALELLNYIIKKYTKVNMEDSSLIIPEALKELNEIDAISYDFEGLLYWSSKFLPHIGDNYSYELLKRLFPAKSKFNEWFNDVIYKDTRLIHPLRSTTLLPDKIKEIVDNNPNFYTLTDYLDILDQDYFQYKTYKLEIQIDQLTPKELKLYNLRYIDYEDVKLPIDVYQFDLVIVEDITTGKSLTKEDYQVIDSNMVRFFNPPLGHKLKITIKYIDKEVYFINNIYPERYPNYPIVESRGTFGSIMYDHLNHKYYNCFIDSVKEMEWLGTRYITMYSTGIPGRLVPSKYYKVEDSNTYQNPFSLGKEYLSLQSLATVKNVNIYTQRIYVDELIKYYLKDLAIPYYSRYRSMCYIPMSKLSDKYIRMYEESFNAPIHDSYFFIKEDGIDLQVDRSHFYLSYKYQSRQNQEYIINNTGKTPREVERKFSCDTYKHNDYVDDVDSQTKKIDLAYTESLYNIYDQTTTPEFLKRRITVKWMKFKSTDGYGLVKVKNLFKHFGTLTPEDLIDPDIMAQLNNYTGATSKDPAEIKKVKKGISTLDTNLSVARIETDKLTFDPGYYTVEVTVPIFTSKSRDLKVRVEYKFTSETETKVSPWLPVNSDEELNSKLIHSKFRIDGLTSIQFRILVANIVDGDYFSLTNPTIKLS